MRAERKGEESERKEGRKESRKEGRKDGKMIMNCWFVVYKISF